MITIRHLDEQEISLYADALTLDSVDRLPLRILDHAADCRHCKQEVLQLYRVVRRLEKRPVGTHPFFNTSRVIEHHGGNLYYRIAAMVTLVIGVGITSFIIFRGQDNPKPVEFAQNPTQTVAQLPNVSRAPSKTSELLAANFEPSANMEDLIRTNFRSEALTVLAPANGKDAHFPLAFRWDGNSKDRYVLRIMTNKENEVLRVAVGSRGYTLREALAPGLYYWILQTDGEAVHAGKFTVR